MSSVARNTRYVKRIFWGRVMTGSDSARIYRHIVRGPCGKGDDLIESERLRLLGFRMVGRARYGVFCSQSARQLCHRVADRSSDRRRQNGFAWTKTSQCKSHLRGEIRNRNTCSAHVIDTVRYRAKIFLPFKIVPVSSRLANACPIVRTTLSKGRRSIWPSTSSWRQSWFAFLKLHGRNATHWNCPRYQSGPYRP